MIMDGYNVVTGVAFSPDGAFLTSVSNDSSMFLFAVDGSSRVQYPLLHEDGCSTIIWLDANTLVTGGNDGQLRTYAFAA